MAMPGGRSGSISGNDARRLLTAAVPDGHHFVPIIIDQAPGCHPSRDAHEHPSQSREPGAPEHRAGDPKPHQEEARWRELLRRVDRREASRPQRPSPPPKFGQQPPRADIQRGWRSSALAEPRPAEPGAGGGESLAAHHTVALGHKGCEKQCECAGSAGGEMERAHAVRCVLCRHYGTFGASEVRCTRP
jgi:hypothetical protein